jgi:hypothetical protein
VALSEDLDEVVAALEALDNAALRAEFNDSAAAAAASRGAEDGAHAGSDAAYYSGDVVEDRSAGQDAGGGPGLSP